MDGYKAVTPRNGYYTPDMLAKREEFEHNFMAIGAGRGSGGLRVIADSTVTANG